jgi:hypothetical protein
MLKFYRFQPNIVFIGEATLTEAERWLKACERCERNATLALDCLLDALTDSDPQVTEYLMVRPARCPSCSSQVNERTRVAV